jgi:hypothetical protein
MPDSRTPVRRRKCREPSIGFPGDQSDASSVIHFENGVEIITEDLDYSHSIVFLLTSFIFCFVLTLRRSVIAILAGDGN